MGEALGTVREPTSAKTVHLGGAKGTEVTPAPPRSHAEEARINAVKAYRDNLTGEIYTDATRCINGCVQLTGDAAEKALREGTAPAPARSDPQSTEEWERLELERRAEAERDERKAAEAAAAATADQVAADKAREAAGETGRTADGVPAVEAGEKAKPQAANKARKKTRTKSR